MATRRSTRTSKPTAKYQLLLDNVRSKQTNGGNKPQVSQASDDEWEDIEHPQDRQSNQTDHLERLLTQLQINKEISSTGPVAHQSSPQLPPSNGAPAAIDPLVYLTGQPTREALDIYDFVHLTSPTTRLDVQELTSPDAVLNEYYRARAGPKRPKLQDVSIAQWRLANVRIMDKLLCDSGLQGATASRHYMAYSAKIFEMFATFDRVSVLEYDRKYRMYQAAHGFPWGTDIPHLNTMTLRPLQHHSKGQSSSYHQDRQSASHEKPTCKMYNTISGCKFGQRCGFYHRCSVCAERHPAFTHDSREGPKQ